jgi:hypothetical protein
LPLLLFLSAGWNYSDRGQIEQKYTSRAAELYTQLLAKEVQTAFKTGHLPTVAKPGVRKRVLLL